MSNVVLSGIVAFGTAVPVYFGILESRPTVWDGELVFERQVERPKPRIRRLPKFISYEELDANGP